MKKYDRLKIVDRLRLRWWRLFVVFLWTRDFSGRISNSHARGNVTIEGDRLIAMSLRGKVNRTLQPWATNPIHWCIEMPLCLLYLLVC